MTDFAPGTPIWVDLATPDADGAVAFYGALFGWTASDPAQELGSYQTFRHDGRSVAGLSPTGGPIWMTHFSTEDADASAARVTELGGKVLYEPMDVADLGRLAVCEDAQGAPFGLWQPGTHRGAELVNVPVSQCWNELHTGDREAAKAFYGELLGWTASDEDMGGETYTVFSLGGRPVAGAGGRPEEDAHWLTWFAVVDADATTGRAQELGAREALAPMDIPTVGRAAILVDPQGAVFGVLQGETADE